MAFHPSTCPFCSCGCGMLLHEEGGRLLGSYPRAGAAGRASLCIRGWNCTSSQSHPERLTTALIRGPRGLVPASPEEAIEEVARRLRAAVSTPLVAVGPSLANEDATAVRALAGLTGSRLCTSDLSGAPAARLALRRVLGRRYGMRDLETIASADLVWAFGADPAECPQVASRVVHAGRSGAGVVRFDVHASRGNGVRAVRIPPDQLGALAAALQKAALQADLAAPEAREAAGFAALAAHLGSECPGFAPLTEAEALALAREFRLASRPVAIIGSRWLTSCQAEGDSAQLLQALALLGAGDRIVTAVGEANSWGCLDVLGSQSSPAELACRSEGLETLIVAGDDLVRRSPRAASLAETLGALRTVVVIDCFANDTLPFAHVVLPSCVFAEVDGTVTNVFGAARHWRRAVPPPGDCRPERDWAAGIARALGLEWGRLSNREEDGVSTSDAPRLAFAPPAREDARTPEADDAAFTMRLVLGTQPAEFSTGAVTQREELLAREARESILFASPDVLDRTGAKSGWPAKLVVPGAEATVTVRADVRLPPDVLVLLPLAGSPPAQLRGSYPGAGRRTLGLQPVPARLERA